MAASFSAAQCGTTSGVSAAVATVTTELDKLSAKSDTLLAQSLTAIANLSNIIFPDISTNVNYNPDAFINRVDRPLRPENPDDVIYNAPTAPGLPDINAQFTDILYDGPDYSDTVLSPLVNQIIDFLNGLNTLPICWQQMVYSQARDREHRRMMALEQQTIGRWSRLGWQQPQGAETRQIDTIRFEGWRAISEANRAIMIKVYEEALISLRFGLEQALRYLQLWNESARDEVNSQGEVNRYQLALNQNILDRLRAAVEIYDAQIRGESTRINAELEKVQKEINLYAADINERELLVRRDIEEADNELEREQIRSNLDLRENEILLENRRRDLTQAIQLVISQADILRQVTASVYQALSVSAQISSNSQSADSKQCSTSYVFRESATASG